MWDAFLAFLRVEGFPVPKAHLSRDVTRPVEAAEDLQEVLITVYRENPAVASVWSDWWIWTRGSRSGGTGT